MSRVLNDISSCCPLHDYLNNCTCYYKYLWRRRRRSAFPPKDEGVLKIWLNRPADPFKRLAGNAVFWQVLPGIVGSVLGAILSFLGKAVGFVSKHKWTLIAFVAGLICVWLMQKVSQEANWKSKKVGVLQD